MTKHTKPTTRRRTPQQVVRPTPVVEPSMFTKTNIILAGIVCLSLNALYHTTTAQTSHAEAPPTVQHVIVDPITVHVVVSYPPTVSAVHRRGHHHKG